MKNILVEKYKKSLDKLTILFESTQSEFEYVKNNHKWLFDKKRSIYHIPLNENKTIFFSEGDVAVVSNVLFEDFWDSVKGIANDVADTVSKGAEEIGKGVKLVAGEISDTFWGVVNGIAVFGENFISIKNAFSAMSSGDWSSPKVVLGTLAFVEIFCMVGAVISSVGVIAGPVGAFVGSAIKLLPVFTGGFLIGNGLKLLLTKSEKKEEVKVEDSEEEMMEDPNQDVEKVKNVVDKKVDDLKKVKNEVDKKIEMVSGGSFVEEFSKIATETSSNIPFVHIITGVVTVILNGKHHITQAFIEKVQDVTNANSQKIQEILKNNESKIYNAGILKSFNTNGVASPMVHYATGMLSVFLGKRMGIVKKDLTYLPDITPKNNKSELANIFSGAFSDWLKNKNEVFKKQVDGFVSGALKITEGFGILATIKDTLMTLIDKVVGFISEQINKIIGGLVSVLPILKKIWGLIVFYYGVLGAYKVEMLDILGALEVKPDSNDIENRIKTFLTTKNENLSIYNQSHLVTWDEYNMLVS